MDRRTGRRSRPQALPRAQSRPAPRAGREGEALSSTARFSSLRRMLVERSMHPGYLSNAYLVADEEGGTAVYVDSGAPLEPLLAAAERWRVTPVAVLRTHGHSDHVEHEDELGLEVVTGGYETGGL